MINLSYPDGPNDVQISSALKNNFLLKSMIQANHYMVEKLKHFQMIYLAVFYNLQQFSGRLTS